MPRERHRKRRRQIESAHEGGGSKIWLQIVSRLTPLQTFSRALERPVQGRISQLPFLTRDEDARRMQNPNQFRLGNRGAGRIYLRLRIADIEVLVALGQGVVVKSVGGIGEENLRPHFRIDRLGIYVGEGEAKHEGTQIIDIRDAAESPEGTLGYKMCVLAALILRGIADASIHHALIVEIHEGFIARTSAKFSPFEPAPFRIVFGAHHRVHAAIEDHVNGISDHQSVGRGVAKAWNHQAGSALFFLHWMGHIRKIQYRYAPQPKIAVVDFGGAIHIHPNAFRVEQPFRMRQFAGSDGALAHQIVVRPVLLDDFPGEGKRIGGGKRVARLRHPQADGSDYAIERSNLSADIVCTVTSFDVLVIRTAIEHDVAFGFAISRVCVVGDFIRMQDVVAIVNFCRTAQVIDRAVFLLLQSPNRDLFFGLAGRGGGQICG